MDTRDFSTAGRIGKLAAIFLIGALGGLLFLLMSLSALRVPGEYQLGAMALYVVALGGWFGWAVVRGLLYGEWLSGNTRFEPVKTASSLLNQSFPRGMRIVELMVIFGFFTIGAVLLVLAVTLLVPLPGRWLAAVIIALPTLSFFGFVWAVIRGVRGKGWMHIDGRQPPVWSEYQEWDDQPDSSRRYVDFNPATGLPMIGGGVDSGGHPFGSSS